MRVRLSGLAIIALLAVALGGPRPAAAQLTAADSAAVLVATAADFEERGELEVARALYEEVVRRYPGTPGAALARARLGGLGAPEGPPPAGPAPGAAPQDRRGDTEFRVWSTMYGLWLGVAVPIAVDAQGSEPYGAGLLLGGPLGYLAGRTLVPSPSVGRARTISWAGTWGTWQGVGWTHALDLGRDRDCDYCGPDDRTIAVTAMAGGLAGLVTGALLSRGDVSEGTAASTYLGSLWGTWFGLGGATALDLDEEAMWVSTLLVGNAGLVAGALAGSRFDLSSRRAHMISLGGLIGGFGGVGIVLITKPGSTSSDFGIPLATSAAGLVLGALLTRDGESAPEEASGATSAAYGPAVGALLNGSGGRLALGLPMPFPTTVHDPERPGRRHTAWNVPLVRLRF